jgi:dolichyl-phosphate-mannose-protein mannosyltransferase
MGRQLFLHHYLPAHLASCLVAGAIVEFVFNIEPIDLTRVSAANPITDGKKDSASQAAQRSKPIRERIAGQSLLATWAATGVLVATLVWSFWYFSPLTYGKPGLDVQQVLARKWLAYDFHFAK